MLAPLMLLMLLPLAEGPGAAPLPPPTYALDAPSLDGAWLSAQGGAGLIGRDGVVGVSLGMGVETDPFALHLRAPLVLRVWDQPPAVGEGGSVPPGCVVVRCEEWLERGALSWDALSRIVEEVRIARRGEPFHLRGGALLMTLGHGQLVSRYTNAADWDRRRSGVYVGSQLDSRALHAEALVGGIASPQELFAARVALRPLLDPARSDSALDRLLGRLRLGLEAAGDATAPVGRATDARGDVRADARTRPIVGTAAELTWPLLEDGMVQVAPWVGGSFMTGLELPSGEAGVGVGLQAGIDVELELVVVALRGGARLLVDSIGHRSAVFSSLYDVDRRRFLGPTASRATGVAELAAPGGVGGAGSIEAIVLDVLRLGARAHIDPVFSASETEVFAEVGAGAVHVAARALQRADSTSGVLVPARLPLFVAAEAAWAVWPPFSVVGRWLRTPRFHPVGSGPTPAQLSLDDDIFVGGSVDLILSGS